jgi:hypothetical protein
MGDIALCQTLQTLADLIVRSRQLRDRSDASPNEIRRVDVMIDWTMEALRERITSDLVIRSALSKRVSG